MTVLEKIAALRAAMEAEGADGVYVPSSDPHMTEYLPARWRCRAWLSGFTGSAGTLCVTREAAALWTDGRYFIQAERQLEGSGITLMRMAQPGVPTAEEWLADRMPAGGTLALDGACTSVSVVESLEKALAEKRAVLRDHDFVSALWQEGRPPIPATEAWLLEPSRAGLSAGEKLHILRERLARQNANAMLVCRLDSVAWLLNLRADDVEYNPFALAYCLVEPKGAHLFIDTSRVPAGVQTVLEAQGVTLHPYGDIRDFLAAAETPMALLYEPAGTSWTLLRALRQNRAVTLSAGKDPIQLLKAVKDETAGTARRWFGSRWSCAAAWKQGKAGRNLQHPTI